MEKKREKLFPPYKLIIASIFVTLTKQPGLEIELGGAVLVSHK